MPTSDKTDDDKRAACVRGVCAWRVKCYHLVREQRNGDAQSLPWLCEAFSSLLSIACSTTKNKRLTKMKSIVLSSSVRGVLVAGL